MKKQLFTIAAVAFAAGAITLTSCKKDDTTAPTITITGGNTMSISLPTTAGANVWTAPTITATDDQDGDISTSVTATADPNVNLKGTYTVTYTVSDAAGNTGTQDLTVTVVNDAESFAGNYSVHDTVPTIPAFNYNVTVTTSSTINNRIMFAHYGSALVGFADYQNNDGIYANISGSTVVLPSQTAGPIGTDNSTHDFNGNGTVTATTPNIIFNITYTDHDQTNSTTAAGCVQTYTHF